MANKTSAGSKMAAGLGLAALTAAAATAYYFSGPKGKQHQKQAKAWAKKAKTDMLVKMKKMKGLSKGAYEQALKQALAKYKQAKNIDPQELAALGRELKGHWKKIAKDLSKLGARTKPAAKKRKK